MNRINPQKLHHSKWTAIQPQTRQKHFIVTRLIRDADDRVTACELEAVINHRTRVIDWQELKDDQRWLMRWK